jgi:alkylation response protein AidB-like acyl-CoA dehydrogenase
VGDWLERVERFVTSQLTEARIDAIWATGTSHDAELHAAIAAEGWIGLSWPADWGGPARHPAETGALWEALNYFRMPVDVWELTEMAAFVIWRAGNEEQRRQYLPAIRAGELLFCLGYTEPESGSDVAAARTTVTSTASGWLVNGSKIFTTGANVADHVLLLGRTDPEAPKHRGLSMFVLPLDAPGVTVRPIHTFGGERTNTVFLDNVELAHDALVGELNGGWSALNLGLDFERSLMGTYVGRAQRVLDDLRLALARLGGVGRPDVQRVLAEATVRIEVARALADDVYCRVARRETFSVAAAMTKLVATEVFKDLSYAALDVVGPAALVAAPDPGAPVDGRLEHWFRHSQIATIYGGSNEIQRSIVAKFGLSLPSS